MLSLDMWHANLLQADPLDKREAFDKRTTQPREDAVKESHLPIPACAIATLRLHYQGDKRCSVFELTAQPDGSLANDRLRLVIMEANLMEQRLGGWFMFTGECPQVCAYANYFQMTPDSMLHNLEN
jgi:hypothetical protein